MYAFYAILGIVLWIALAFWPARVARRKGYSWLLFFIFSCFFFFAAIIVAYAVKDKNAEPGEDNSKF